ncbi:hypothetical protein [Krasilnikovia sp. MM14-A1259]|uniref:hypothetical protein n=1 Tax=Krasilnikovia sp. MM14-A1259 TaxID=3373539 RepID=UPI00382033F8
MLRMIAPALRAAVAVAAGWTALVLAVPAIAIGKQHGAGRHPRGHPGGGRARPRRAGHRLLPLALIVSASTSLLIFLVIACVLPTVPGFVSNSHPPVHTQVTRLVDPVAEFDIPVLLAAALGIYLLCTRIRTYQTIAREQGLTRVANPHGMIVERPA